MIRLLPTNQNFTPVPDRFILKTMAKLSSTVIKVYLFLLYQFHHQYESLGLDEIADSLQVTESDVFRAIKHLAKANLLVCRVENDQYTEIGLASGPSLAEKSKAKTEKNSPPKDSSGYKAQAEGPTREPSPLSPDQTRPEKTQALRPSYSASTIEAFAKDVAGDQLIFYTKTLFHKELTPNDLQILYGLHDWLGMSFDLIQFLIEYCVENNHTRLNYVEKVAINWHENHIETIDQAKNYLATYPNHYYTILKAYGIYNLAPIPAQIKMIDKWTKDYLFPLETIVYACEKTILQTAKAELNYTDSILRAWKEKNLFTKDQVLKAEAATPKQNFPSERAANPGTNRVKSTSFNSYDQRKEDYDAIEKKALEMRINKKEPNL